MLSLVASGPFLQAFLVIGAPHGARRVRGYRLGIERVARRLSASVPHGVVNSQQGPSSLGPAMRRLSDAGADLCQSGESGQS